MRKNLLRFAIVLLSIALLVTPAAAGHIGYSNVTFTIGSLITQGTLTGLGNTDVTVTLIGTAVPVVTCTNLGGNQAPGQNPPHLQSSASQNLNHNNYTKNGTSPFGVETLNPDGSNLTATQLGCPNDNWTAQVVSVTWTNATINVSSTATGALLASQNYVCVQPSPTTITCTLTN